MRNHSGHNPFASVLLRELQRMTARPIYVLAVVLFPLFTCFFMATIFNTGEMEDLPVGVVDMDFTSTSRSVTRMVQSSPTLNVTQSYANQEEAHKAVQKKEIYGYLVIPNGFEQKVGNNEETTLSYYYHYALLSVGCEIQGAFEVLLRTVSATPFVEEAAALAISEEEMTSFVIPTTIQSHPIYNPDLNYAVYLSQPFFFVIFQVLILLITVYAVGSEVKFGTAEEWLSMANGSMCTALAAKLLPYTLIFSLITVFANYIFFGPVQIPYSGTLFEINIASILFVLATQGFALLVFMIFPAMSYSISIISMIGSLGATLSGITFPLGQMYGFFDYASFA